MQSQRRTRSDAYKKKLSMEAETQVTRTLNVKPPPIIVSGKYNYKTFCGKIKSIIGSEEYIIQYKNDALAVFVPSESDYDLIINELRSGNIAYHTYTKTWHKTKKVVIKAAPNMDVEEIKEDLLRKNVPVKSVVKLNGKNPKSYSYFVTTDKEANMKTMKHDIQDVNHLKIKWERFARFTTHNASDAKSSATAKITATMLPLCQVRRPTRHQKLYIKEN